MAKSLSLSELFEDTKYPRRVLAIGAILLLLLQSVILAAVCSQSGLKSRVCILDSEGRKIYESTGTTLSSYEKIMFENNFGPLRNYATQIESDMVPFNYRAWILLAVGIPLGLMLMLFFMAQVWLILLNGSPKEDTSEEKARGTTRFTAFLSISKNFSVLGVGFIITISMLILWLIPSILGDVAASFFRAVGDYPFFFMGMAIFFGGLIVWVIYLRYKLSKQMLSNQMEIEKYRIQKQMLEQDPVPRLLTAVTDSEGSRTQFTQPGEH